MNIQAEKIELVQMLLETNSEELLKKVKKLLSTDKKDWWDEISSEEKAAIDKGIAQLDAGEGVSHENVMGKYKKRL